MKFNFILLSVSILVLIQACLAIEKPSYTVVKSLGNNAEVRTYSPSKWVTTSTQGNCMLADSYQNPMFMKLFSYISGNNDQKMKIEMTAPVLTNFTKVGSGLIDASSSCSMSMGFYVPKANQNNTPNPSNGAVVVNLREITVAVLKFGWYPKMADYIKARNTLINLLGADASGYDTVNIMTAGYDAPYKFWDRTNEVWLRKF